MKKIDSIIRFMAIQDNILNNFIIMFIISIIRKDIVLE